MAVSISVLDNDSDPDAVDSFEITSVTKGINGSVAIEADGSGRAVRTSVEHNDDAGNCYTVLHG